MGIIYYHFAQQVTMVYFSSPHGSILSVFSRSLCHYYHLLPRGLHIGLPPSPQRGYEEMMVDREAKSPFRHFLADGLTHLIHFFRQYHDCRRSARFFHWHDITSLLPCRPISRALISGRWSPRKITFISLKRTLGAQEASGPPMLTQEGRSRRHYQRPPPSARGTPRFAPASDALADGQISRDATSQRAAASGGKSRRRLTLATNYRRRRQCRQPSFRWLARAIHTSGAAFASYDAGQLHIGRGAIGYSHHYFSKAPNAACRGRE